MNYPVYCEQALINNFFEPLNTLTNLAFILAGILLFIQLRKEGKIDFKGIFLSSLLIIIGSGSFVWHLYRNDVTLIADSVPIALFIFCYLFFYLRFVTKKTWHLIILFVGFFVYTPLITIVMNNVSLILTENGGGGYLTAISYFLILQIYNIYHRNNITKASFIVIFVFLISLGFRQIDLLFCNYFSVGTHFIWHILNALTLYLFVKLLYPKAIL